MRRAALPLVLVAGLVVLLPAMAARAHEDEEEVPARTLVQQAIVLIRSQPEQVEAIEDKIHDALEATDTEGVDLALLEQADRAFEAGELHEAQDLLERSIGAAPHQVVASPNPEPGLPTSPAPAEEPSPVLHERGLEGGDQDLSGGPFLLGAAVLLAGLGVLIVARVR